MIIVSLHSQMGNQMFQYAFAKATAKKLRTRFLLFQDEMPYNFQLRYFKLDLLSHLLLGSPKTARQLRRICRKLIKYIIKQHILDPEWKILPDKTNNTYYQGYFQSDSYFSSPDSNIKTAFLVRSKYKEEFRSKYSNLLANNKIIVVHTRRKDYLEVNIDGLGGPGIILPMRYYNNALNTIENQEEYQFIFIGDDIDAIKKEFGNKPNYHFEKNSPIIDFQLIQHADIAIIANSTFAWWAAYLSQKKESLILAPKYWLGFKIRKTFPSNIMTAKFKWIEF